MRIRRGGTGLWLWWNKRLNERRVRDSPGWQEELAMARDGGNDTRDYSRAIGIKHAG
jgi:hypothetical protein